MMKTLTDILAKQQEIIDLAQKLGFSNQVKLCTGYLTDTTNHVLHVVVQENSPSMSYKCGGFLEAQLIDLLKCKVNVIIEGKVNALYRHDLNKKSALIHDQTNLKKLFDEKVVFTSLPESAKELQESLLRLSNEYIQSHRTVPKSNTVKDIQPISSSGLPPSEEKIAHLTFDESHNLVHIVIRIPQGKKYSKEVVTNTDIVTAISQEYLAKIDRLTHEEDLNTSSTP